MPNDTVPAAATGLPAAATAETIFCRAKLAKLTMRDLNSMSRLIHAMTDLIADHRLMRVEPGEADTWSILEDLQSVLIDGCTAMTEVAQAHAPADDKEANWRAWTVLGNAVGFCEHPVDILPLAVEAAGVSRRAPVAKVSPPPQKNEIRTFAQPAPALDRPDAELTAAIAHWRPLRDEMMAAYAREADQDEIDQVYHRSYNALHRIYAIQPSTVDGLFDQMAVLLEADGDHLRIDSPVSPNLDAAERGLASVFQSAVRLRKARQ